MRNTPFIYAVAQDRKDLMAKFNVGAPLISHALRFYGNSVLQRQIRSYAVNFLECGVFNMR